jgi:secreted trypsin-like serine protease
VKSSPLLQIEGRKDMKKPWVLVTLVLVLAVGIVPAAAITGGEPDGYGHPNVGAILVPPPSGSGLEDPIDMCSGTLVSEEVFLTAGHCTDFLEYLIWVAEAFELSDVSVSFAPSAYEDSESVPVVEIITHPDYVANPGGMGVGDPDVGVLILGESVSVMPAALPDEGFLDNLRAEGRLRQRGEAAKFTVVGYGVTLEWPPPVMMESGGIRRVAVSEFLNLRKAWLHMSQNQAPGKGDAGTCYGDSGGPTFWTEEDGTEVLVALTSWGDMQCVATGTACRIDTPTVLQFIEGVVSSLDDLP